MFRWLFSKKRRYVFRHIEEGAEYAVDAVDEQRARAKMRNFIKKMMYGDWALTYDPQAVERQLNKCENHLHW